METIGSFKLGGMSKYFGRVRDCVYKNLGFVPLGMYLGIYDMDRVSPAQMGGENILPPSQASPARNLGAGRMFC